MSDGLSNKSLAELRAMAAKEFGFDGHGVYFPDARTAFQVEMLNALWLAMWEATS